MAEEESAPQVDVVEPEHKAANYAREREEKRDTTDDAWGNGVFSDQSGAEAPRARSKEAADDAIPDLRLRSSEPATMDRPDDEEDEDDEMSPVMLGVAALFGSVVMFAVLYGGLTIAGIL